MELVNGQDFMAAVNFDRLCWLCGLVAGTIEV